MSVRGVGLIKFLVAGSLGAGLFAAGLAAGRAFIGIAALSVVYCLTGLFEACTGIPFGKIEEVFEKIGCLGKFLALLAGLGLAVGGICLYVKFFT